MNPSAPADAGPQARYQAFLDAGAFRIQRCGDCRRHVFHPRVLCPHCGGQALEWMTPAGTGRVYSFSTIAAKPEAGGDYNVSLVDLDEGVRLMSRVEGVPPAGVSVGMRVRAEVRLDDGTGLVVFVPEAQA